MNTLSLFPDLFGYQILGVTALRIVAGLIFIYFGYHTFKKRSEKKIFDRLMGKPHNLLQWSRIIIALVGGALLFVGLYTQAVVLVLGAFTLVSIGIKIRDPKKFENSLEFFVLLFFVLFAILVSGPGIWAFDLPL